MKPLLCLSFLLALMISTASFAGRLDVEEIYQFDELLPPVAIDLPFGYPCATETLPEDLALSVPTNDSRFIEENDPRHPYDPPSLFVEWIPNNIK